MDTVVFLIFSLFLFATVVGAYYLLYKFITVVDKTLSKMTPLLNVPLEHPKQHEEPLTPDTYTPETADRTQPLTEFVPNFSKPLKIKIDDEDQITPMEDKKQ